MAGRAGVEVAQRGSDKHLHYSRGVTIEEMRQASMAVMKLIPTGPGAGLIGMGAGMDLAGRDQTSDGEVLVLAPG